MTLTLYKLGGSLLDLSDLETRLDEFFRSRPADERRLLLVGGGKATDLVREWDQRFDLGDEGAHLLALESMRLTMVLVSGLIPDLKYVAALKDVEGIEPGSIAIVIPRHYLSNLDVPHSWEFTSDSIAALIANQVDAGELVLLKSVDLPQPASMESLIEAGLVDREFPNWTGQIAKIGWVNLRRSPEVKWVSASR